MITAAVMEIVVYIKGQINTYMSIPPCVAQSSTLVVKCPKAALALQTNVQVFHICPLHVLRALWAIKNHQ